MNFKMKRVLSLILALCLLAGVFTFAACKKKGEEKPDEKTESAVLIENCGIIHEPEFGGVYIKKTIEEFDSLGVKYGDSVNVEFSNGYKLEGIPYYNGYYTKNGEPLLIAYPGYDYIKAAINNGDDLFTVAGLTENDTATVTLAEAGKFADIQKARDIHYEDDREKYESDEQFANFRSIAVSTMKEGAVYRSASPCDNQHCRAPYVDKLMMKAETEFILNLSDNEEKIEKYMAAEDFDSPYFEELYLSGSVKPIALNMNYSSQEFKEKIASGLTAMAEHEGPYLVHCTEGKDRTGFVCMLLEALTGASYEEIENDYMLTYDNYYGIKAGDERYDVIVENVLVPMIESMAGEGVDIKTADLSACAERFLLDAGMSAETIAKLKANIAAQ
ncbi:MAG: tyrosine-protein phosphatase [Clostridia bacterium]|nr:tyrosine-protein phosphatase [Clostridia bacterium]